MKIKENILSLVAACAFCALGAGSVDENSNDVNLSALPASINGIPVTSPKKIQDDFEANELRAKKVYLGKEYIVIGIVNEISNSALKEDLYVDLKAGFLTDFSCYFNKGKSESLEMLSKGDKVKIRGTIQGQFRMDDCTLLQ